MKITHTEIIPVVVPTRPDAVWADLNNDNWPDLAIASDRAMFRQALNLLGLLQVSEADWWHWRPAGVNIDEEMANLLKLQTAYGANARVLSVYGHDPVSAATDELRS